MTVIAARVDGPGRPGADPSRPSTEPVPSIDTVRSLIARYSNWGRWGPDDELGTLNHIQPSDVVAASGLVRSGRVFSLSIPVDENGPQSGGFGRFNPIHLMIRDGNAAATGTVVRDFYGGRDRWIRGTDDLLILPLQSGTQWDALGHIVFDGHIYNGYDATDVGSRGAIRNDIAKTRDRIVGRAVLLDIPRVKGVPWLEPGDAIHAADLEAAAIAQGVDVGRGDIVLIRTGQMAQCRADGAWGAYAGGEAPGLALDTVGWIHDHDVAAIASDTWGVEVLPNETPDVFQPLHIVFIVHMGLLVGEIFDLEALATDCAADGRYEFLFTAPPLAITGGVGSPVNPLAIK
ncbi:MAG TPA: cyclase family protein [Candidatus Limnocylindrales bacterium]|nr:cyclase family protein [Candidatus Limnocylindrales bacterium]